MDILQYIDKIKQNYGNEPVPVRYNTQKYLRPGFRGAGLVDHGPAGVRQGYGKTPTSRKYIEKGIYRRDNGNYRLVANREGAKKLDKTLPKGSTLEDARKALSAWEKANPIKVKWKEGQKIKLITEGPKGKQVNVDIKYKTPKIEADFKAAMADFAGENKGGWSKNKFNEKFGNISQDAMQFAREQDPTLVRDLNKIQTLKYADELEELGHKDWNAAIKAGDDKYVMKMRWETLNPYERKGFDTSRNQLAKNIENLNKFEKSGQTLDDFYDLFKDRQFKMNLRAYMKGEAGPYVTQAWDEAGFKSKYKNIIPKMKKHLEVWHEQSDPLGKTKAQIKKGKIKKFSRLDIENLIGKAKRVGKTDYLNQLDLAHRQDLVIDQNISELGIERPEINRVLIKDAEIERNKLHKKNFALVEEIKKGKNVQKNLSLIAENNHRIQQIADITKGRLTGIIIDTETLAPVKLKPSNIMGVDAGIFNKPIKEMTEADKIYLKNKILPTVIDEARAMTPEKIASELSGIMDDPVLSEKLETRISKLKTGRQITKPVFEQSKEIYKLMQGFCGYGKSAGGRIGFKAGSCPANVAARNFARASEDLVQGRVTGEAGKELAEKIGRVSGKAPKSLLTKLLGPYGVAIDVVFEAGSIGTDVLRGKPLNEAVADNWITGSVYKKFTGKTGQKLFNERLAKMDSSTKLYGDALNIWEDIDDLYIKLERLQADRQTSRTKVGKEAITKIQKEIVKKQNELETMTKGGALTEPGTPAFEAYHNKAMELRDKDRATSSWTALGPAPTKHDVRSDRYKYDPMGMKIDFSIPEGHTIDMAAPGSPTTTSFKPTLPAKGDVDRVFQDLGYVHPIGGEVSKEYADELITEEKWRQLMEQPGIRGTQERFFAGGGLANLTRTVAPDSGPVSRGLSYLYNRARRK